ncbi:hypothetical protein AWZ03_002716 [Drosophila navojoa]|uniref:Cilia- and flagella-associated protein 206 n=1 Tax=Drosophila navojoa TaxID=7232 RepID=A0A484BPN7_DRONA|nr:uncharacterized protein LOC108653431 [Drosophila navojoa]TDG50727.1 hypothetical protein AWZ03_002716 [Drosophila navojoa]
MSHTHQKVLDDIRRSIESQLEERDIEVDGEFIAFVVHLLIRDVRLGLVKTDLSKPSTCHVRTFVENVVSWYLDDSDTTMANLRLSWIMKTGHGISLAYVREQYEKDYQQQLKRIIDDILQYPETCSKVQLDQLFSKMQVFIVATNHLGCPKNHVLLKLTAQALHSVIGRSDLQNYVLKKKYHRQEYLKRLADTVAGILIFNNDGPDGDRENVRNIIEDLQMAQANTNAAFDAALERLRELSSRCQTAISEQLQFDCKETTLYYGVPFAQLDRINQFTITFNMLMRCLVALQSSYEHTTYLLSVETGRYDCVVAKINASLAMRTSIDSELIFPHFVYLAKVWANLNHYFNHIVELNKLRERVEAQITSGMVQRSKDTIAEIQELSKSHSEMRKCSFNQRMDTLKKTQTDGNFCSLAQADIKEFCALAMAVTNGLLLPAKVVRKLCMNVDIQFGFQDETYARIGELWFERFITALRQSIFNNANLVLLFQLDHILIAKELQPVPAEPPKTKDFTGQTEMVVTNDLKPANWINVTWNAWDYHRETIHLAEIRKRQTCDTQSTITYGKRNAQNQTYNVRHHLR